MSLQRFFCLIWSMCTKCTLPLLLFWKSQPDVAFSPVSAGDSVSTAPTGGWRLTGKAGASLLCHIRTQQHRQRKEAQAEAPHWAGEQTWDAGGQVQLIHRWVSSLRLLRPTPWRNSTMCSSDCCCLEIPGLEKRVYYADSRTTNSTRLTSPPLVIIYHVVSLNVHLQCWIRDLPFVWLVYQLFVLMSQTHQPATLAAVYFPLKIRFDLVGGGVPIELSHYIHMEFREINVKINMTALVGKPWGELSKHLVQPCRWVKQLQSQL